MKTGRQFLKSVLAGVIWLGLIIGCKQAPQPAEEKPETVINGPVTPITNLNTCDDGTCCGGKGVYYKYHETFSGDTVILRGNRIEFGKPIPTGTTQAWATNAIVCTLTAASQGKLNLANNDDPIKCRIWGRVYTTDKIFSTSGQFDPMRYFAVDYVEAIK